MLEDDYEILSAICSLCTTRVFLLIECSLNANVNLAFADDGGRLIIGDVAVKSFEFWVVAVYVPYVIAETLFLLTVGAVPGRSETDHRFVWASLRLAHRPSLAGNWKFNNSLLEIRDFRDRLEKLIQ